MKYNSLKVTKFSKIMDDGGSLIENKISINTKDLFVPLEKRSYSENCIYSIYQNNEDFINRPLSVNTLHNCIPYNSKRKLENSESSNLVSFTDIKLANLRSKFKAETEEIRKWKVEIREKLQTKSNSEFYLNISSQRINQSKKTLSSPTFEEESSHSYPKYRAICVFHFPKESNLKEVYKNDSPKINTEHSYYQNKQTIYLQNESGSQENENLNFSSSSKSDEFKYPENTIQDFLNENQEFLITSDIDKMQIYNLENDARLIKNTIENPLEKEINDLKLVIQHRDKILDDLRMQISNEIINKDQVLKENVNLKMQEIEMKTQMTNLLSLVNNSKCANNKLKNFSEEQERISTISEKLKILINENKNTFKSIRKELSIRNEKLVQSLEIIKFLENKLNLRNTLFQKTREQLEVLTTNIIQLQTSSRSTNNNLTDEKEQLIKENLQLLQELDCQKKEAEILSEKNELITKELYAKENAILELKKKVNKLRLKAKEFKQCKLSAEEKVLIINQKLLANSKELSQKDENIIKLEELLKLTKLQCNEAQSRLTQIETLQKEDLTKIEKEIKNADKNHNDEKLKLTEEINEWILQLKKYSKASERKISEQHKKIIDLENQLFELKQQRIEMVEYLYKLPTSSIKWTHFFQ